MEIDCPQVYSKIQNATGDLIIDFKFLSETKIICVTQNSFLSCYDISMQEAVLLTVKKLDMRVNESPNSLEVNKNWDTICVASLLFEENSPTNANFDD